ITNEPASLDDERIEEQKTLPLYLERWEQRLNQPGAHIVRELQEALCCVDEDKIHLSVIPLAALAPVKKLFRLFTNYEMLLTKRLEILRNPLFNDVVNKATFGVCIININHPSGPYRLKLSSDVFTLFELVNHDISLQDLNTLNPEILNMVLNYSKFVITQLQEEQSKIAFLKILKDPCFSTVMSKMGMGNFETAIILAMMGLPLEELEKFSPDILQCLRIVGVSVLLNNSPRGEVDRKHFKQVLADPSLSVFLQKETMRRINALIPLSYLGLSCEDISKMSPQVSRYVTSGPFTDFVMALSPKELIQLAALFKNPFWLETNRPQDPEDLKLLFGKILP
ncbi:MAG: hypothetical protein KGZ39_07820, partial [Simkania sp.]|nr:hypothetical protein [Simkania sp.]